MILTWFAGDFFKTVYFIIEVSRNYNAVSTLPVPIVWHHPAYSRHLDFVADPQL